MLTRGMSCPGYRPHRPAEIMNLTGLAVHEVRHALVDTLHGQGHNLDTFHCG